MKFSEVVNLKLILPSSMLWSFIEDMVYLKFDGELKSEFRYAKELRNYGKDGLPTMKVQGIITIVDNKSMEILMALYADKIFHRGKS